MREPQACVDRVGSILGDFRLRRVLAIGDSAVRVLVVGGPWFGSEGCFKLLSIEATDEVPVLCVSV